jgi:AraC family transcriptional regulator
LAKIAVTDGPPMGRILARSADWTVYDVICGAGPSNRPFPERHSRPSIAIVLSGTFQYRSGNAREMMTPGSIFLGNTNQAFECGHEHGVGDRCLSISFAPEFFDRLTADAGNGRSGFEFRALRLPPLRDLSPLIVRASAAVFGTSENAWDEFAVRLAAQTAQLERGISPKPAFGQPGDVARVTRVVRMMEAHPADNHNLASLASEARLSPYHFLRLFEGLTGATPHQYLLRTRLRQAAERVRTGPAKILDVALDCGFGDVSNFNRMFRAEFGVSPRRYRLQQ